MIQHEEDDDEISRKKNHPSEKIIHLNSQHNPEKVERSAVNLFTLLFQSKQSHTCTHIYKYIYIL